MDHVRLHDYATGMVCGPHSENGMVPGAITPVRLSLNHVSAPCTGYAGKYGTQVLNHPLVEHKLTVLRDKNTPSSIFRELVSELVTLEAYEATRNLEVVDKPIETPVAPWWARRSPSLA